MRNDRGLRDRIRSIDWDYIRSATWWLVPLGFFATTAVVLLKYAKTPQLLGFDASLYTSATMAWIQGGDPWMTSQFGIFYAAPPPSLVLYLPFVWMPPGVVSLVWMAGSFVLAILAVHKLRLAWWWMAFPPLADGILVGNGNVAVLALLVLWSGRLAPLAVFLKIYALIPMVGERRWRDVAISLALLVVTAIVLPWGTWIAEFGTISSNLARVSATTSVYGQPIFMLIAAISLFSLGMRRAGWLAVPLLWPTTQPHYAAVSVPGLTPYLALAWCYPAPEVWVVSTAALAIFERINRRPQAAG